MRNTLTRLISEVREKATLRLWNKLALIPSAEQRSQLEMLLVPTDCTPLTALPRTHKYARPLFFTLAELVTKGHLRPLKEASEEESIA